MSHELRTPLNSTLILAKLLADNRDGNLAADQVRYAQTISSAGNDLLALINDILDLSRIEAGQLELKVEPVSTKALLDSLAQTFRPVAEDRKLAFRLEAAPAAPASLQTDSQRLLQILKNLLSNAFKFTRQGEVAVEVRPAAGGRVAFAVRDTGIGIPKDKLEVIFEAFRQADGSTHRQFGGTGLGLSISRDLAHRLGGEILVDSEPGRGSTFTLTIPARVPAQAAPAGPRPAAPAPSAAAPPPAASPAPPLAAALAPAPGSSAPAAGSSELAPPPIEDDRGDLPPGARTLLVIEDDLRFARIVEDLAHEQSFRCLVAASAAEGLALARRYRPSAVVLDVNLPDASGLSVLEQLKRSGETRHIPVHVFSVADHAERALQLGAVGYAVKPVQTEQLVESLQRLEQRLEQKVRRVLVVEDAPAQREGLVRFLRAEDVEGPGPHGPAGPRGAGAHQLRLPGADLGLPDLSGYQLLEQMAGNPGSPSRRHRLHRPRAVGRGGAAAAQVLALGGDQGGQEPGALLATRSRSSCTGSSRSCPASSGGWCSRRAAARRSSRQAHPPGRGRRAHIFALSSVLEPKGAAVQIARNGREALEHLERGRWTWC
jgi:CheY-like chemotaxis protein/two-component sensor histidine kinase